jgi:hypothetical protein
MGRLSAVSEWQRDGRQEVPETVKSKEISKAMTPDVDDQVIDEKL